MTKCAISSTVNAELCKYRDARAGVATTISGASARSDRCTFSGIFFFVTLRGLRLTVRISFEQKAENVDTASETCLASSWVGTRMRADVALWVALVYLQGQLCNGW